MGPTIKKWALSSWSPIRCQGTPLPANLLLLAKLIIICLFFFSEWKHFKVPFLPFLPIFDLARSIDYFPSVLSVCFFSGALLVFFNRYVRMGCLLVGLSLIIAILAVRFEFRNHAVFASFLLILISLYDKKSGPVFLRLQIAIVYFGAGLNKFLDPDWLNGQFFENWTHERLKHAPYMLMSFYFPPMLLSQWFSWISIVLEFSIAIGFLIPRLYPLGIWLGIFLHGAIMIFTVDSENLKDLFEYFLPAALSSYLVFFKWPETTLKMQYDPHHPFILSLKKASKWIDCDQFFNWEPFPVPHKAGLGRPYLRLQTKDKTYLDFKAVKVFLLLNPLTYFVMLLGFLFITRIFPFAVGMIWDSRYIPYGALIKTGYFLALATFFFPLFESLFDSWIKKGGIKKSLRSTS
jgi:methylamine utilization protein MauE